MRLLSIFILHILLCIDITYAQDLILGAGSHNGVNVTSSDNADNTSAQNTISSKGFMPNLNAASRFLSQATFGPSLEDIQIIASQGLENWIDDQFALPIPFDLVDRIAIDKELKNTALNDPDATAFSYYWRFAWWHYIMTSNDELRQRIAFALSEFFVISDKSSFGDNAFALGSYYDMLHEHSFGNYRELIEAVTFHLSMGEYLTYLNNTKADTVYQIDYGVTPVDTLSVQFIFPDENYARELTILMGRVRRMKKAVIFLHMTIEI